MVAAARRGQAQRAVARRFGIGPGHLQYWLARTRGQRLDRVDWSNQSNAPRAHGRQTKTSVHTILLCGVNCDKAIWDSLAHRPSRMRCGPNVLTDGCRVCAPSGGSSSDTGLWMPCGVCVAVHRPQAGICRRWRRARRNWTPSMSSRICAGRRTATGRAHDPRPLGIGVRGLDQRAMRARWLCEPGGGGGLGNALASARLPGLRPVR